MLFISIFLVVIIIIIITFSCHYRPISESCTFNDVIMN
jgi:hypothetical protein